MARFWGFVQGKAKTAATRLGTEKTGGSNDNGKMELIAIIKEGEKTICAQQ